MALTSVQVQFNGKWYTLSLDAATGQYKGTVTAPSTPGDSVPLLVRAVNSGGYQAETKTSLDIKWELIPPVAKITSPSGGGWYTDAHFPVSFTLRDETNGSGVAIGTLVFTLDGVSLDSASPGMVCTAVENGYDCTYTPPERLSEGQHTVTIAVQDIAGNLSESVSVSWNIDTVAPALTVAAPPEGLITNNPKLTIIGTAGDVSSGLVSVAVNGSQVEVLDGAFAHTVALQEGTNHFTVTATDAVGHQSTITRAVLLDTVPPVFTSVHIQPDLTAKPLGTTFVITVKMKESAVSPKSRETVTGTVNGTPLPLEEGPALTWTAKVARAAGDAYNVVLHAWDEAGNEADYTVTFPCGLESKWDWTPAEFLNYWDLNRIEYNTNYLYMWLQENGCGTRKFVTKTDWVKEDIPLRQDIERIRRNVDYLQECYFTIPEWRRVVYNGTVDAGQMNAFEWDLHLVDIWLSRMVSQFVYSGTLHSGMYP